MAMCQAQLSMSIALQRNRMRLVRITCGFKQGCDGTFFCEQNMFQNFLCLEIASKLYFKTFLVLYFETWNVLKHVLFAMAKSVLS